MQKNFMIKDYIDKLHSKEPVPGGGSAAALAASLSAALSGMVFNLTIGKKSYNEYSEEEKTRIDEALEKLKVLKDELLDFMDKDGEAFLTLISAFKLPQNNEEEKLYRKQKIQEGYKTALKTPFDLVEKSFEMYEFINTAAVYGNKNAISDAGVAAILLQSAIESAVLNVGINLSGIKDDKFKKEIKEKCSAYLKEGQEKKEKIMSIVVSKI